MTDFKNTKEQNTKEQNTKDTNINNKGGKVLASGGFGCVFTPALKCKDVYHREKNKVSKLMTESHAREEYEEITSFKTKLNAIKNYRDYFLIYDATLCKPAKLKESDLVNYTKKCYALKKTDITKNNINDNLDKLMLLNIPNGGLPVDDYIHDNGSYEKLYDLHISLIHLFKKGILPMNAKNIYHCDIKDSNVLVDGATTPLKTRLIDWGLSTEYTPFKDVSFPQTWKNRPLQFNVPFSVLIFTDMFVGKYSTFLEDGGDYKEDDELRPFVLEYVTEWMKARGAGHYKFINEIMFILFSNSLTSVLGKKKPDVIESEFTMPYIVNYIMSVLQKYTKFRDNGKLNLREYLDNVFIKNVDVWGFINVYFPMLELLYNNYSRLNRTELFLFGALKGLFVEVLYLTADEAINKNDVLTDLTNIRIILYKLVFGKIELLNSSTSSDKASGVKTRKNRDKLFLKMKMKMKMRTKTKTKNKKVTTNISFTRVPKVKRFKNPIFLNVQ